MVKLTIWWLGKIDLWLLVMRIITAVRCLATRLKSLAIIIRLSILVALCRVMVQLTLAITMLGVRLFRSSVRNLIALNIWMDIYLHFGPVSLLLFSFLYILVERFVFSDFSLFVLN